MNRPVDEAFPHLTTWVTAHGWIEIGYDDAHRSFIRALESGGMVWEGGHGVCHSRERLAGAGRCDLRLDERER